MMKRTNMIRTFDVAKYDKICKNCEKTFKAKIGTQKYCNTCREERKKKGRSQKGRLLDKVVSCNECKRDFNPSAYNQKYCSECRNKVNNRRDQSYKIYRVPFIKCPTCGKHFTKTGNNQKRCDLCQNISKYRKLAFENFSHKCNRCGKDGDLHTLDVHHKDRNRDNNELSNLEILCKPCHHNEHIIRGEDGTIIANI